MAKSLAIRVFMLSTVQWCRAPLVPILRWRSLLFQTVPPITLLTSTTQRVS